MFVLLNVIKDLSGLPFLFVSMVDLFSLAAAILLLDWIKRLIGTDSMKEMLARFNVD